MRCCFDGTFCDPDNFSAFLKVLKYHSGFNIAQNNNLTIDLNDTAKKIRVNTFKGLLAYDRYNNVMKWNDKIVKFYGTLII